MASRPLTGVGAGPVAVIAMAVTGLSTLLPWTTDGEVSVLGIGHDDAFLVIATSVLGIVLYRMAVKPAWIAPGFAAVTQFRDITQIRDSAVDVGIGLWIGLMAAVVATVLLIADLLATIRASAPIEDTSRS